MLHNFRVFFFRNSELPIGSGGFLTYFLNTCTGILEIKFFYTKEDQSATPDEFNFFRGVLISD
jgi:hypothetical protein